MYVYLRGASYIDGVDRFDPSWVQYSVDRLVHVFEFGCEVDCDLECWSGREHGRELDLALKPELGRGNETSCFAKVVEAWWN